MSERSITCIGVSQGAAQLLLHSAKFPTQTRPTSSSILSTAPPTPTASGERQFPQDDACGLGACRNRFSGNDDVFALMSSSGCLLDSQGGVAQEHASYHVDRLILLSPPVVLREITVGNILLYIFTHCANWLINNSWVLSVIIRLVPTPLLALLSDFVTRYLLGFYSTTMATQAKERMYKHTPSGNTSVRNMDYFIRQLRTPQPLGSDLLTESGSSLDLQNIRCPVTAFFGELDCVVDTEKSAEHLSAIWSADVNVFRYSTYGHLDFHWTVGPHMDLFAEIVKGAAP